MQTIVNQTEGSGAQAEGGGKYFAQTVAQTYTIASTNSCTLYTALQTQTEHIHKLLHWNANLLNLLLQF